MTSTQIIFERAVRHHIHDAFVSLVERIDDFNIGTVLLYHEKPHWWRKKEIDFTGAQLADLISEDMRGDFSVSTESSVIFDETSDSSQRTVDIDLDLDGEVKFAVADLGADIGGSAKKIVKINVGLGAMKRIKSNIFDAMSSKQFKINPNHPVIKDGITKGRSLFVISSVYESQKVEITVSREEDADMKGDETGGNEDSEAKGTSKDEVKKVVNEVKDVAKSEVAGKEEVKANAGAVTTGITVTKRERPSNIAFIVMKVDISKQGLLVPEGKSGFSSYHKVHASYGDSFDHIDKKKPAAESEDSVPSSKEKESPKEEEKKKEKPADGGDKKDNEAKE